MTVCVGSGVWEGRIVGVKVAVISGVEDAGVGAQLPIMKVMSRNKIKCLFIESICD